MIGQHTPMVDAYERVTGRLGFTINAELPGMLHVAIRRSDVPHARLRGVDTSAAGAMPGVVAVLTARELTQLPIEHRFGPVFQDQPVVAIDTVRYIGEPVAAVAATSIRAAGAAAALIDMDYDELPAVFTSQDALADGAPILHPESSDQAAGFADIILRGRDGNVCNSFVLRRGDVEQGFADADEIFEHEFSSPAVHHLAMEPHACLANFEGDRLVITTGTQTPYAVRDAMAGMFGLPTSSVRVIVPPLGGGFGGKTYPKVEPLAAVLAYMTRRPVKVVLPREEDFLTGTKHDATIRLRTGVNRNGTIVAKQVRALFNAGAYTDISPRLIKNGGYACAGPYRIPHVDIESQAVFTNIAPAGAFRGYGVAQAAWAYESQMDMIAAELGIDRFDFRRRNLLREGESFATGEAIHGAHFAQVLDDALSVLEPDGSTSSSAAADASIRRGQGCAVIIKSTITPSTSNAVAKLNIDGSMQLLTSTVEMGQGAHTALGQIAAQRLGVPLASIRVVTPDTDVTPYDITTSSSRSTAAMGAAVRTAVDGLRAQLMELAADQLEATVADLEFIDGGIQVAGDPSSRQSLSALVTRSRHGTLTADGRFQSEGGLDPQTGQGIASEHWHQGAAAVEVEVDTETGKIRVSKLRASVYAGTVVNPINARMQVEGSVLFGLSQALVEEITHDAGFVTNPNLSDYAVAGLHEIPERFEVSLIEDEDDPQMHGLGETALPVVMPAVANAVADALGVRLHRIPLTAERVLMALEHHDEQ